METERPNPDALLERVTAEERTRGRLKIYLGMAAGSGKTYAMLSDALVDQERGVDVVAGYIEPHGRVDTERLAHKFQAIAARKCQHRGIELHEFDLDAALARHPKVLLIDELAHSNAPDARHRKRWQDVEECLSQGINVFTTINVQHVESLSDIVQKITGVQVLETVPDQVIRKAEEIELIDVTPEELRQRIKEGKVYLREKADTALNHFFTPGNLMALRELVLRLTAERVDEQLATFRRQHQVRELWPARPRVLVCVSPNFLSEKVVRTASRLASSLQTEWVALSVERSGLAPLSQASEVSLQSSLELAERLGAKCVRRRGDDIVAEILAVARDQNASIVVLGKSLRSRLREYLYGSVVDELVRQSGDLDVHIVTHGSKSGFVPLLQQRGQSTPYGGFKACILVALTTGFCGLLDPFLDLSNLMMFYLLAVAWAAAKWGHAESVITAVLGVLAFDFVFVPPRWTFAVAHVQYVVTFVVMLTIGLLISTLTARLRAQAELVAGRERRTSALYQLSKLLAAATSKQEIAKVVSAKSLEIFGLEGLLFFPDPYGKLIWFEDSASAFERESNEIAVAQWVSQRKQPAGAGTMTLAGAKGLYVPLPAQGQAAPVLAIKKERLVWNSEQRSLFEAFSSQIASTLERVYAESEATQREIEVERERLRNVLLSSVSHDFRTPLTAISGAADALQQKMSVQTPEIVELLQSIKFESEALSRMVRNVLDLTRLESGELKLRLEWESIEELVGAALQRTQPLLGGRSLRVALDPRLPLLHVDAGLLLQVLVNLLENVAKHAPESKTVEIEGRLKEGLIELSIADDGPGLPAGAEMRVFDKAYRGRQDTEGFGLGLTICAAVLRAHGGSIVARNRAAGGAQFVLSLPIPKQQPEITDVQQN